MLFCGCTAFAKDGQTDSSVPDRFLIGRHTFIDVGPPNDFYEIISVRGTSTGTTVERVTLIPPGDACIQPPKVETVRSAIPGRVLCCVRWYVLPLSEESPSASDGTHSGARWLLYRLVREHPSN